MTRTYCAEKCRPMFEEAALAHHEADPGVAGEKLGHAQKVLFECLGIPATLERAVEEVERWFSFFGWWCSARLLNEGKQNAAWELLMDLAESFGPHSAELGIEADYGFDNVKNLYDKTMGALASVQDKEYSEASRLALEAADLQYALAVERAGR